jgi:hypothetical protein
MDAVCPQNHRVKMTWHGFKQGKRCPKCALKIRADKRRTDPEFVRKAFETEGYQLLEQYRRNSTRMNCICPEGHQIKMDWSSFKDGVRCAKCSAIARGAERKRNTAVKVKVGWAVPTTQLIHPQ